jgi:hypothetical protein
VLFIGPVALALDFRVCATVAADVVVQRFALGRFAVAARRFA